MESEPAVAVHEPSSCHICSANSGVRRISPGRVIWQGAFWNLEHAYPSALLGWLVVVLRRHGEELHDLSRDEWLELADLQFRVLQALKGILPSRREYSACFAEKEGFRHLHFHLVPKTDAFSEEFAGSKSFRYINPLPEEVVAPQRVTDFCENLHQALATEG